MVVKIKFIVLCIKWLTTITIVSESLKYDPSDWVPLQTIESFKLGKHIRF